MKKRKTCRIKEDYATGPFKNADLRRGLQKQPSDYGDILSINKLD